MSTRIDYTHPDRRRAATTQLAQAVDRHARNAEARRVAFAQLAEVAARRLANTPRQCPVQVQGLPCRRNAGHSGQHSVRLEAGQSIVLRSV